MKVGKMIKMFAVFAVLFGLLAGCASKPIGDKDSAAQAIEEAKAAVAAADAGGWHNDEASNLLKQAEDKFNEGKNYDEAAALANKSQQFAAASKAIYDAKQAAQKAQQAGSPWRDNENLIGQAEQALAAGDTAKAIELANEARRQAENALSQLEADKARKAADEAAKADSAKTSKAGKAKKGGGTAGDYTVRRGDSLWSISGKGEIYGDPYQWPLLYKANRSKIKDADLIYPGQGLTVDRNASSADIKAAARHAKTRGSWSLGVVEDSDRAYLGK